MPLIDCWFHFGRGVKFARLVAGLLNYKRCVLCATQSEVLPKSFEQNLSIQKAFPPLPSSPEWASGQNGQCPHLEQAHWFEGHCVGWEGEHQPTSGSPTLLSQDTTVCSGPLWLVMPLSPPISSWRMLNECTTLALTGLICTKKRRGGGGGGRKKGGREKERKGERKRSEWHHNITMHLEVWLANTAGPATVKRLMSHNSEETVGY